MCVCVIFFCSSLYPTTLFAFSLSRYISNWSFYGEWPDLLIQPAVATDRSCRQDINKKRAPATFIGFCFLQIGQWVRSLVLWVYSLRAAYALGPCSAIPLGRFSAQLFKSIGCRISPSFKLGWSTVQQTLLRPRVLKDSPEIGCWTVLLDTDLAWLWALMGFNNPYSTLQYLLVCWKIQVSGILGGSRYTMNRTPCQLS